jgi:hypothetical protein
MRDRLIELLKQAEKQQSLNAVCGDIDSLIDSPKGAEFIADYLLANGVVVPPCNLGDTVYFLNYGIELCEARIICIEDNYYTNPQMWITVEFFSKVIGRNTYKSRIDLMLNKIMFLTREEAERALKGGE